MPLAACRECAAQISTLAPSCPNCGCPYRSARVVAKPDWLLGAACGVIVLTSIGYGVQSVLANARATDAHARGTGMARSSYTNIEAAHVTFTNMQGFTAYACLRAVVKSKRGSGKVESVAICTGDVKPHSSVTIEAPYPVGEVKDICSDPPGQFGIRNVNWDLCTFDLVDLTSEAI